MADCNNHCIRRIFYDVGECSTLEIKGIPSNNVDSRVISADNDDTENTTTNKS